MYLIFTSRKTSRPLHVVSFGSSGSGKSHLQEKIGELIPQEDKIEITSLTGNAFYYFDKDELGHKVIIIEDLDGALAALYPIRELQSKQLIRKTVTIKDRRGNTKTIHLVVYGPVCIAGCTTQERIYEDNANRSFLLYLDESSLQDEKIMDYQRQLSAGKINTHRQREIKKLLQNSQRVLQTITVINPYAELLKIPKEVFKPRRTNAHYIAFIEAITFYKQYQREQKVDKETGELYLETTLEDIEEANRLMKPILLSKSDELSGGSRNYFEKLKHYLEERKAQWEPLSKESPGDHFTNAEIRKAFREKPGNQKRYMVELQQYGYVKRAEGEGKEKQGNQKKGFYYQVVNYEEYQQLEAKVTGVLEEIVERIKSQAVQSSQAVQVPNEPLKAQSQRKKTSGSLNS
jgi:ABC-type dipeptide/oligopeptide/nickel transport system ATPase component